MNVPKKVTDFIVLDEGSIGRKAATVTGAALAASMLGTVLQASIAEAALCDWVHTDNPHQNHNQYSHSVSCP